MTRTETAGIGLAGATVEPRSFALNGDALTARTRWFTEGLQRTMVRAATTSSTRPGRPSR